MTTIDVDRHTLNNVMEFDRVIRVNDDGTVESVDDVWAPDCHDTEIQGDGWTLLNGWSGQYGYSGPAMHSSEFIGGRLADHILNTPGVYVALIDYPSDDDEPEGWVIARLNEN